MSAIAFPLTARRQPSGLQMLLMLLLLFTLAAWLNVGVERRQIAEYLAAEDGAILLAESSEPLATGRQTTQFRLVANWRRMPLTPWLAM